MSKPRIVKDYDKLGEEIQAQIKLFYPFGFEKKLVKFKNAQGMFVSALPFETDEYYFLVRMTVAKAQEIVEEDDDYDDDGNLTEAAKDKLEDKIDDGEDLDSLVDESTEVE